MPLPADLPLWVYGYAVALALVHGVSLYYLYRASATMPAPGADSSTETDAGEEDRSVVCENCGAENELGYRYCWNCVRELSGAGGPANADRGPVSRGIL